LGNIDAAVEALFAAGKGPVGVMRWITSQELFGQGFVQNHACLGGRLQRQNEHWA
jgi:hypothetical protein